jgi:hypothetical protein
MWLLNFLPSWFFHLIVLAGVAGLVASFILGMIPFISQYKIVIQAASIAALVLGIYFEGQLANEQAWQLKVAEMNAKIAQLEAESSKENIKYVPQYISDNANRNCTIPNSFVVLHDSAAKNQVPDASRAPDETASGVNLSDVAKTVVVNYTTYNAVKQQLESLQEWVKTQEQVFNK